MNRKSLGCYTLQLGSQKAKRNAPSFGGQIHPQMPSHQYRENWMVPGNEDRDITADVDASDWGETMERLSLVILPDTNRTSLTATVIRDGDAAADFDASDLGQTMERLPLMVMLLLLPLLYDVDRVSQTAKMIRNRDTAADVGASDLGQAMERLPMEILHYMKRINKATW
ncbi:hypothetical protein KC354_g2575 [Hortaea werneckii]|nr:hypothetical protein KC354_g2575 [Hortaea werneckii]